MFNINTFWVNHIIEILNNLYDMQVFQLLRKKYIVIGLCLVFVILVILLFDNKIFNKKELHNKQSIPNNCNQLTNVGLQCNINIDDQECPRDYKYKDNINIVVSIERQILFVCKKYHVLHVAPINSGIPNHPDKNDTPEGIFRINNKVRNTYLIGKDYKKFVKYWIPFLENRIGFHDTPWKNEFGGDTYKTKGSFGCINVMNKTAKFLMDNVSIGNYVIIKS